MTNKLLGEVAVEACGKTWTLQFDFARLMANEDDLPGIMDGGFPLNKPSALATALRVGLLNHHPDADAQTASQIVGALGILAAGNFVRQAINYAFVPAAEEVDGEEGKNPQPAPEGAATPKRPRPGRGARP